MCLVGPRPIAAGGPGASRQAPRIARLHRTAVSARLGVDKVSETTRSESGWSDARGRARGVQVRGLVALLAPSAWCCLVRACGTDAADACARTRRPRGQRRRRVTQPTPKSVVHVRNLLVISKAPGSGVLSASLVTDDRDELTGVTATPIKSDGSEGAPADRDPGPTRWLRQRRADRADRPAADRGDQRGPACRGSVQHDLDLQQRR